MLFCHGKFLVSNMLFLANFPSLSNLQSSQERCTHKRAGKSLTRVAFPRALTPVRQVGDFHARSTVPERKGAGYSFSGAQSFVSRIK